jgi:hypothetical protein
MVAKGQERGWRNGGLGKGNRKPFFSWKKLRKKIRNKKMERAVQRNLKVTGALKEKVVRKLGMAFYQIPWLHPSVCETQLVQVMQWLRESSSSLSVPSESETIRRMMEKEQLVIDRLLGQTAERWKEGAWKGRPWRVVDFGGGNGWFGAAVAMRWLMHRRGGEEEEEVEVWVIEPEDTSQQPLEFRESAREGRRWVRERLEEEKLDDRISMRYLTWNGCCVVEMPSMSVDLMIFRVSLHHVMDGYVREQAMRECERGLTRTGVMWMKEHDVSRADQQANADLSHFLYEIPRILERSRTTLELWVDIAHYLEVRGKMWYWSKNEWKKQWTEMGSGWLRWVVDLQRDGTVVDARTKDVTNYSYLFWQVWVVDTTNWKEKELEKQKQTIQFYQWKVIQNQQETVTTAERARKRKMTW